MLGECLEIFQKKLKECGESLILDEYVLKDGTYIIVGKNGEITSVTDIKRDKKSGKISRSASRYDDICYYDYHSDLISMNKPQDPAKIVHSNNYLCFWVKKESISNGKLKPEVIEKYYDVLENPGKKYEKSKAAPIYQKLEETLGKVDTETLQRNKQWILEHIFSVEELSDDIDMSRKDYLKIFFEADREEYEREGNRYFLPNIYNSNNYNVEVNGEILGLPDNNQGMNAKKPFLSVKTRKSVAPYLLNRQEVILQKQFFDYLMKFASVGKNNLYVDLDSGEFIPWEECNGIVRGFFLQIKKGKTELEIQGQDVVPFFNNKLKEIFTYKNVLEIEDEHEPEYQYDKECRTYQELEKTVNDIFFSKMLINNYFSAEENIRITDDYLKRNLLLSRRRMFEWFRLGNTGGIKSFVDKVSLELIKGSVLNGYRLKAAKQINLRLSLLEYLSKGEDNMGDFSVELRENLKKKLGSEESVGIESDREYYFAVGQMAGYFIYLSKASKKVQSLINPFLNARGDKMIKERLQRYYKRYNYDMPTGLKRVNKLYAMVLGYEPNQPVMQDMICMGFTMSNLLLEKEEKENE